MAAHPILADDMVEIVEGFLVEVQDLIEDLDHDLLLLETNAEDADLVNRIFRGVHTIKGTSGFLSLTQVTELTHHFEDVLNRLRRGELAFNANMMDVMLEAFDTVKVLLQQVEDRHIVEIDLSGIIGKLVTIGNGETAPEQAEAAAETPTPAPAPVPETTVSGTETSGVAVPEGVGEPIDGSAVFSEDMLEIIDAFVVETHEIFDDLDNDLLLLEHGSDNPDLVNGVFRAVHTVKGTSSFLGLKQLTDLAHHFEDVLNRIRRGQLTFNPAMMDVMLLAFDQMKSLVKQVEERQLVRMHLEPTITALNAMADGTYDASQKPEAASVAIDAAPPDAALAADAATPEVLPAAQPKETAKAAAAPAKANEKSDKAAPKRSETIRVEVDRLDSLMDLVGELVLGRNRLLQVVEDVHSGTNTEELIQALRDTTTQIDFISSELQGAVMKTRMVQIGRVFSRFPRMVRDLARGFGKQINLVLEGEETEVDKSLIEEIGDPLVHLIRNACDHGVESPEARVAAGKPAKGNVLLSAAHEGNHIVIRLKDDGAGIDADRMRAKAVEKGLMTQREADELTDAEAFNIIFRPGFSTAQQLSQVSGRGVGMDVVKTNITRLNGTVTIDSVLGEGTTFTLKLPLTLAIIQSLMVRVARETYAVPLHAVIEVVAIEEENVETINGHEVIRLREQVMPLLQIKNLLDVPDQEAAEHRYAVIIGLAEHRVGIVVDGLVGQKEIVIKSLGSYLKKTRGISGSTIMGDGSVILILDVGEVIRMASREPEVATA
ncbi:MAG: chemotaxis protein CheA [Bacteroidota bacterium]